MEMEVAIMASGGFDEQLNALYAEKELLEKEVGVSNAEDLISMIRSLEEQLSSLYAEQNS